MRQIYDRFMKNSTTIKGKLLFYYSGYFLFPDSVSSCFLFFATDQQCAYYTPLTGIWVKIFTAKAGRLNTKRS